MYGLGRGAGVAGQLGKYATTEAELRGTADKPGMYVKMERDRGWDRDLEAGGEQAGLLGPGASALDNLARWGFVRKVYGILAFQLAISSGVAALMMFHRPTQRFVLASTAFQVVSIVLPLLLLFPLWKYRQQHPHNLVLLTVFTLFFSVPVGIACTVSDTGAVLEALILTGAVVVGLTSYTFYATRNGKDFGYLGPVLWAGFVGLFAWTLIGLYLPLGGPVEMIVSLFGAGLFSAYIVYDTHQLIKRYPIDEYGECRSTPGAPGGAEGLTLLSQPNPTLTTLAVMASMNLYVPPYIIIILGLPLTDALAIDQSL